MPIVKVKKLSKNFNSLKAVDNISFEVEKGEIFGLLGPNGAGKTTTIRMLTGVLEPTSGSAKIGDYDIEKEPIKAKQIMGIVPEMANAYIDISALKNLLLVGQLYGFGKERNIKRAENLLKQFKLYKRKNGKVKTFSKGMKQRLILAMALMNDSKILFLDEPTSGLDVKSSRLIKSLVKKYNDQGVTIFLTTHNIQEASLLCNRVAIMNRGKIVAIDRPEKLKEIRKKNFSIEVAFKEKVQKDKLKFGVVDKVEVAGDKFKLYTEDLNEAVSLLVDYSRASGNKIISIKTMKPNLEDIFVKLTED